MVYVAGDSCRLYCWNLFGGLAQVTVESYKHGVPLMAKGAVGDIATQDMCVLRHGEVRPTMLSNM